MLSTPLDVCIQPARVVEALVDEELAPGHRAVGVEPLVARHLQLGAEEERRVRVDQQQRVAVDAVFDGAMAMPFEPVGSARRGAVARRPRRRRGAPGALP